MKQLKVPMFPFLFAKNLRSFSLELIHHRTPLLRYSVSWIICPHVLSGNRFGLDPFRFPDSSLSLFFRDLTIPQHPVALLVTQRRRVLRLASAWPEILLTHVPIILLLLKCKLVVYISWYCISNIKQDLKFKCLTQQHNCI